MSARQRPRCRGIAACALALVVGCSASPPAREPAEPAAEGLAAQGRGADKPGAPVAVTVAARALGGGDYAVTMVATPAVAVTGFDLLLDGRRVHVGATAAGEARTLATRVHVDDGVGREVVAGAAIGDAGSRRTRAAVTRIGAPLQRRAQRVQVVTMPDGSEVAEVRQ